MMWMFSTALALELSWSDGGAGLVEIARWETSRSDSLTPPDAWAPPEHPHEHGVVWFSVPVRLHGDARGRDLRTGGFVYSTHTQIWADDVMIAEFGGPEEREWALMLDEDSFPTVPAEVLADGEVRIAVRVKGLPPERWIVGDASAVRRDRWAALGQRWYASAATLAGLGILLAAAWYHGLQAALRDRTRENLFLGATALAWFALGAATHVQAWSALFSSSTALERSTTVLRFAGGMALVAYIDAVLGQRSRLFRAALVVMGLCVPLVYLAPRPVAPSLFVLAFSMSALVGLERLRRAAFRKRDAYWGMQALALGLTLAVVLIGALFLLGHLLLGWESRPAGLATELAPLVFVGMAGWGQAVRAHRVQVATSRFVPMGFLIELDKPSVIDVALGDARPRTMTVLFSDIRGFTALSEALSPAQTFAFINEYLGRMEPEVTAQGGFVDKYIGDAVMALFPSADNGVAAARRMLEALDALNVVRRARGELPVAIGIGLHTGPVMLGTVGGLGRMDGTVVGDAVNLASRVEGMTKDYGAEILITDATRAALTRPVPLRLVDRVTAKGKAQPVDLFEVLRAEDPRVDALTTAIDAYRAGRPQDALTALEALPDEPVVRLYRDRCAALVRDGVPADWTPVVQRTSK